MTTIICTQTKILCDTQITYADSLRMLGYNKIVQPPPAVSSALFGEPESYIGFAGDFHTWLKILKWFSNPESPTPKSKNIELIALTRSKKILHGAAVTNLVVVPQKFFAIGSGMGYALGAMSTGATPEEAIKIASRWDIYTGSKCNIFSF